ncbi:MAG TPA: AMP-binding protein, partial [Balneolaceae bacterium]|nr:AMP-binding protein [Balneolaceae bacterium]
MLKEKTIKQPAEKVTPNLENYEREYSSFNWDNVKLELAGLPEGGLNIAYEAVDRYADGALKDKIALRWLGEEGALREFTYENLKYETNRFANVLQNLEVKKGDVVCSLTGRIPELYLSALGSLKNGSIYCPLFSIYGPEPIYQRLSKGKAKVLVTSKELFEKKVKGLLDRLKDLK